MIPKMRLVLWIAFLSVLALGPGACQQRKQADASPPPPAPPPTASKPADRGPASADHSNTSVAGGGSPRDPKDAIPQFPWPPPTASARVTIPAGMIRRGGALGALRDVDTRLSAALDARGYVERSYFAVPHGFAIVTRLEQIDNTGKPRTPPARWNASAGGLTDFSLSAYLRALFTAEQGRYRVIVFTITGAPFTEGDQHVTSEEALEWLRRGLDKLPPSLADLPYTNDVTVTALIYEFERTGANTPAAARAIVPSTIGAREHLSGAGLWSALGGQ
jgi:hypothetical protein